MRGHRSSLRLRSNCRRPISAGRTWIGLSDRSRVIRPLIIPIWGGIRSSRLLSKARPASFESWPMVEGRDSRKLKESFRSTSLLRYWIVSGIQVRLFLDRSSRVKFRR